MKLRAKQNNKERPSKTKSNYSKTSLLLFILLVCSMLTVTILSFLIATQLIHPDRTIAKHHPSKKKLPTENVLFQSRDSDITLSGWMIKAFYHMGMVEIEIFSVVKDLHFINSSMIVVIIY
jgi:hypothetical protein